MADPLPFATPNELWQWFATYPEATELWILYHRKTAATPSVDWEQAVEQALIWGWIDGIRKTHDETRWIQRFTPRKPRSSWSQKNRATAERLIAEGLMQQAGLAQVQAAKSDGRWDAAYAGGGEAAQVPQDFLDALAAAPPLARETYSTLKSRHRYAIYYRTTAAKQPATRARRIAEFIARLAEGNLPI